MNSHSLTTMKNLKNIGIHYAWKRWRWYFGGILALVVTNIIMLEIPQLAKEIVNAISENRALGDLLPLAVAIVGLGCLLILIRTMSRVFIFWPGRTLETEVKDDLFAHILRLPTDRIEPFGLGDLTSRLSNDVTQLRVFFAFGVLQVLNVIFMTTFTVAKMAAINPILTALTVTPLLIMLGLTRFAMPKLYKATREATEATGRLTNKVTEAFHHVNVIQAAGSIEAFVSRSQEESLAIFDANMRTVKIRNLIFPLMMVMAGFSGFAILTWGGSQVIAGKLSVGDLMAFNIYVGILVFPFTSIGLILAVYQRAKPAAERLGVIASIPAEPVESFATIPSEVRSPLLEIKKLTFRYAGQSATTPAILSDITVTIPQRRRIGIYGPIGSGKTTLFNLLTRLYEPPGGSIYLSGIDLLGMSPPQVRQTIAYAQQTPLLFSASIRENMLLGFEENTLTEADLERAAQKAEILDEIRRFPQGWDTVVGESGIRLSGGQKQRLALARILLRQAQIIILDDVLSAVDQSTERSLIQNLMATNATLLIASHRTSILKACDEVWVLEQGQLRALGRYADVASYIEHKADPR